jgi:hypothetical protein
MHLIMGTRLYGKVDETPKLWHVATNFFHVYYCPLIPTGSYAVFDKQGDNFRGVPIRLNFRSVLVAWLRCATPFLAFAAGAGSMIAVQEHRQNLATGFIAAAVALLVVCLLAWRLKSFKQATYERALAVANQLQLSPIHRVQLDLTYKRITLEEAEAALAKIMPPAPAVPQLQPQLQPQPSPAPQASFGPSAVYAPSHAQAAPASRFGQNR